MKYLIVFYFFISYIFSYLLCTCTIINYSKIKQVSFIKLVNIPKLLSININICNIPSFGIN